MKITNPSVTLKDGLWYGYTVEVPEEPKQKSEFETKGGLKVFMGGDFGHSKRVAKYQAFLASANASLVKIRNQEEVSRVVLTSLGCSTGVTTEDRQKAVDRKIKPESVYRLDGYVMEVKGDCLTDCMGLCEECDAQQVATISPIQKQEPQAASFPDFEKYSAYKESKTVATSGTNYVAPDNQEELWRAVSKEINEEGLWQYEDWDGFKLTEKGIHYLKEQFTITRKP